ncbi:right-handed parallel beta-helix repeat-containing protein [Mangrovibacterium sp.]|uniref:alpha-1,3-galactosidase-related protein n=1 Tax=Mangrovibacterium sp. TaxID=1961364 RepID=UPI0035620813
MKLKIITFLLIFTLKAGAQQILRLSSSGDDMTEVVRAAMVRCTDKNIKLVFEKGTYFFRPDYALAKYCVVTNHGNGLKKIIFNFEGYESVEIEGNGSEFIFHGQVMPFLFDDCDKIQVRNLTIDWDIPFLFQSEVLAVNEEEQWIDVLPYTDGFSWQLKNEQIQFPNIDGFIYPELGSTMAFDKVESRVAHGAWDFHSSPRWVEEMPCGMLRIHETLKHYPEEGDVLCSKGDREHDRYAPAFQVKASKNVLFENTVVHHALGMAYLFERTENISILNCGVYLREGSSRVVSSTADATHFANCKGDILIENCRFENMLDDGTNVHGTYVEVSKILNEDAVQVELKHFEQYGFEFAAPGDEVWFVKSPDPGRGEVNIVLAAKPVNERFIDLQFERPLPKDLKIGDVLENKTWNPTFTMRGCTIRDHRARNVVLKTPLKTVVENNYFSSMMSSILFRGETFFWFESGAVEDVVIRNNTFDYCAYSGTEHAVLFITPKLGSNYNSHLTYDRNIRFENNKITTFDNRIVWADRVDGLVVKGNTIIQTFDAKPLYPDAPLIELSNCKNVSLTRNSYEGICKTSIASDQTSGQSLMMESNAGF